MHGHGIRSIKERDLFRKELRKDEYEVSHSCDSFYGPNLLGSGPEAGLSRAREGG
jgi:hypothetical protein